jgi:hypothetical protein
MIEGRFNQHSEFSNQQFLAITFVVSAFAFANAPADRRSFKRTSG